MSYYSRRQHYLSNTDTSDIDVELMFDPNDDPLTKRIGDKLVVAYNVHDDSPQNPLEDSDCYGEIHHHPRSRYGRRDSDYYNIWGLDQYGDPVVDEDKLQNKWVEYLEACLTGKLREDPLVQMMNEQVEDVDMRTHCKYAWVHNCRSGDTKLTEDEFEQYFEIVEDNVLWDYDTEVEDCYKGPDPDAVLLDLYEHSGCIWSVHNSGPNCRWDTSGGAATWIPNDCLRLELDSCTNPQDRRDMAVKFAEQACEAYTSYCNGDVYGCVVEVFELKDEAWVQVSEDSCWGFIGYDYAEDSLNSEFFGPAVKRIETEHIETNQGETK